MRKSLIVSMLVLSSLGFAHRSKSKPSPPPVNTSNGCTTYGTTTICIPRCKDVNARNQAFEEFKNQLISSGYTIVRSMTSDTTFDVLVRDKIGLEHWEHKQWCSF